MVKVDSVSHKALKVARQLDQFAARPGKYVIEVDVSPHGHNWTVEFSRVERVGRYWSDLDDSHGGYGSD